MKGRKTMNVNTRETPFRSWFLADWRDVTFLHFAIDPQILQPHVPLPLDLFNKTAWVSLVAFTQTRLRTIIGGRLGALAMRPVANHPFLNLRTYVRHRQTTGIFFLAEWIPNFLSRLIGPRLYGLPLHLARLHYSQTAHQVHTKHAQFSFNTTPQKSPLQIARNNTLESFLLERYTAFTARAKKLRRFDIRHDPWLYTPTTATLTDTSLITTKAPWFAHRQFVAAHHSPGVFNVKIGHPKPVCDPKGRLPCPT